MAHINYVFEEHNKTVDGDTYIVVPAMSYLKKMMTIVKETSNEYDLMMNLFFSQTVLS